MTVWKVYGPGAACAAVRGVRGPGFPGAAAATGVVPDPWSSSVRSTGAVTGPSAHNNASVAVRNSQAHA
ncbi:hypothetical protein ACIOHS_47565 [Streptomyces sp. NPDC088253]|uniref:hypothetical protein n=1 Tax=Streptomyces sp. NPDC088253 TaxID=3365846 RepID=UPI0038031B46